MERFLAEVFHQDGRGIIKNVMNAIMEENASPSLYGDILDLLYHSRFFEAHTLARLFARTRRDFNPILFLALALGGLLYSSAEDESRGRDTMRTLVDNMSAEQRAGFCVPILHNVVSRIAATSLVLEADFALHLLHIYAAGFPPFRRLFEWSETIPGYHPGPMRERGRARARLIPLLVPPDGARRRRRALVAVRERVQPLLASSRLHDMGARIAHAFRAYGWDTAALPMTFEDSERDFTAIIAQCEAHQADLLVLDDYSILQENNRRARDSMIRHLKERMPALKIVALHFDPWMFPSDLLIESAAMVDGIWTQFPSLAVWRQPVLARKMVFAPMPHATRFDAPPVAIGQRMAFIGSVAAYNWHRCFWIALAQLGLPIDIDLTTHAADGLPVLASYRDYLARLQRSGCTINFSMREALSRSYTGRCHEAILAGALLVQEETADMDHYFVAGEHYLSFETVSDLRAIATFIADDPEGAREIRDRGTRFARETYADERIIGHLDCFLSAQGESLPREG